MVFLWMALRGLLGGNKDESETGGGESEVTSAAGIDYGEKPDLKNLDSSARRAMENMMMLLTGVMKLHYDTEEHILFQAWHPQEFESHYFFNADVIIISLNKLLYFFFLSFSSFLSVSRK